LREINVSKVKEIVKKLCIEANYYIGKDVIDRIEYFLEREESPTGKEILQLLLDNYRAAAEEKMPICQLMIL